jgi:hypothetical protein
MRGDFDEDEFGDEAEPEPTGNVAVRASDTGSTGQVTNSPEITGDDLDNLFHMLGVSKKHRKGYRNYFVAGAADVPSMERLRAAGFVVKNEGYTGSGSPCYHATIEGAKKIGLKGLPR